MIEQRAGALKRSNAALIVGTYILRTAIVQSLKAFGNSGLELPLLLTSLISIAPIRSSLRERLLIHIQQMAHKIKGHNHHRQSRLWRLDPGCWRRQPDSGPSGSAHPQGPHHRVFLAELPATGGTARPGKQLRPTASPPPGVGKATLKQPQGVVRFALSHLVNFGLSLRAVTQGLRRGELTSPGYLSNSLSRNQLSRRSIRIKCVCTG